MTKVRSFRKLIAIVSGMICVLAALAMNSGCTAKKEPAKTSPTATGTVISMEPEITDEPGTTSDVMDGVLPIEEDDVIIDDITDENFDNTEAVSSHAEDIKNVALAQGDVEDAAAVVTHSGDVLVAITPKDASAGISEETRIAIANAAGTEGTTKITVETEHVNEIKALETAANGNRIAVEDIETIWGTIELP